MKTSLCLLLGILLLGCSGNHSVLKKDTEQMSRQIDSTLLATHAFYHKLEQQKINFLLDFMASQPNCTIEPTLHILLTEYRCLNKQEIQLLARCRKNTKPQAQCQALSATLSYPLIPRMKPSRHATISLLGIVASYQHALSKVLTDRNYDISTELRVLKLGLNALGKQALKAGTPTSVSTQPAGSPNAISTLSGMMFSARTQKHRFKDLQTLVLEKGPAIEQALEDILNTYLSRDRNISTLYELQLIQRSRQAYNRLTLDKRKTLGKQQRKQMISRYYEQAWQQHRQEQQPDAISLGLRGLLSSQKQLREGFKGHLTDEQRQRIAQENKAQLKSILKSMFDIVKYIS